jgi:hypothetical protein
MALRTGHGAGAGVPRIEVLPPDEQPFAPAGAAVPLAAGRDAAGRVRSTAAARALAKLPRRGSVLPRKIACDPRFEPHNRRRLEWLRARRAELYAATGGVSHGVGAMLASAAWLYAGSEFAAELGAASGNVDWLKTSAALSTQARGHDMGAWEMAVREAKVRTDDTAAWAAEVARADAEAEAAMDRQREAERRAQAVREQTDGDA